MIEFAPSVRFFGVTHQNFDEAETLRKEINDNPPDYLVLDLPAIIGEEMIELVEKLPEIWGVSFKLFNGEQYWLSNDPCEVMIEAIRQAQMKRIPIIWGGENTLLYPRSSSYALDPYLRKNIGVGKVEIPYLELTIENGYPPEGIDTFYKNIKPLMDKCHLENKSMLVITTPEAFPYFAMWYQNPVSFDPSEDEDDLGLHNFESFPIHPNSLYFALGEWPINTALYESTRRDVFGVMPSLDVVIKKAIIDTKRNYLTKGEALKQVGPARLQKILDFGRRLALVSGRIRPSLFDMVEACKGVLGDRFALQFVKAVKDYPFFDIEKDKEWRTLNPNGYEHPTLGPVESVHLFRDLAVGYENLKLRKELPKDIANTLKSEWDERQSCSHIPEDISIEGFNSRARRLAFSSSDPENAKSVPFSTHLGDGIDIRETLRNWGEKRIYIKEVPQNKFKADTVLLLFDTENDAKYPNQMVWFAEHDKESTLSFYATEALKKMIGPGIAELEYGGLSLLFPPRPTFNPFIKRKATKGFNLSEKLLWGAIYNTSETHIIICSEAKPTGRMHEIARVHHKFLIHIPFSQFGQETLNRLKRFHMLNGKEVRTWAKRFIGY